jgi:hypothetical protein
MILTLRQALAERLCDTRCDRRLRFHYRLVLPTWRWHNCVWADCWSVGRIGFGRKGSYLAIGITGGTGLAIFLKRLGMFDIRLGLRTGAIGMGVWSEEYPHRHGLSGQESWQLFFPWHSRGEDCCSVQHTLCIYSVPCMKYQEKRPPPSTT